MYMLPVALLYIYSGNVRAISRPEHAVDLHAAVRLRGCSFLLPNQPYKIQYTSSFFMDYFNPLRYRKIPFMV